MFIDSSNEQFIHKRTARLRWILEQCVFLVVGFVLIIFAASFLPKRAAAFWPFFSAHGAANDPFIPSASTPVLEAPTNSNQDAAVPVSLVISDGSALLPSEGPGGFINDTSAVASSDKISVYVVRAGDTLSQIAAMFGVSINTIIWANNLKNARDVHPGDTLIILPVSGIEYTVKNSDTFVSIAKKYAANATEIATYNGLDPSIPLIAGSSLIIPGGELATPASSNGSTKNIGGGIYEPYLGGSGALQPGYYGNPLPGGIITQGIHGWNAVDIGAPKGTPVHAAADGTVIIAKDNGAWNGGYGNYVVITHGNDTQTLYAHMTHTVVTPGETAFEGEVIGYVGMTGLATGPHLHFEVRGAANPFRNCPVGFSCAPQ